MKSWFGSNTGLVGLDLGSTMFKAVTLERRHGQMTLKQAATIGTPTGVLTAGTITDGISVARALRVLCDDNEIKENNIAGSISGEKVFAQTDALPSEYEKAVEQFVERQAERVIPYAIESTSWGYEEDDNWSEKKILWVASPAEQVDWLRESVGLSGKSVKVIQPQVCALANLYSYNYKPRRGEVVLLLNVGARHMSIVLMSGETMLYGRDCAIAKDWISAESDALSDRVWRALSEHWDAINERGEPSLIRLSGGGAGSRELVDNLPELCGIQINQLDPFRRVDYLRGSVVSKVVAQHGSSLGIAIGLALSGFKDL